MDYGEGGLKNFFCVCMELLYSSCSIGLVEPFLAVIGKWVPLANADNGGVDTESKLMWYCLTP